MEINAVVPLDAFLSGQVRAARGWPQFLDAEPAFRVARLRAVNRQICVCVRARRLVPQFEFHDSARGAVCGQIKCRALAPPPLFDEFHGSFLMPSERAIKSGP